MGQSKTTRDRAGQPTKLTPELLTEFTRYLTKGMYITQAAALCGITSKSVYNWLRWGKNQEKDEIYNEFFRKVQKATAKAENDAVNRIWDAGVDCWQANAWLLERRFPARWSRHADHTDEEVQETRKLVLSMEHMDDDAKQGDG